jgi:hypothetical protein
VQQVNLSATSGDMGILANHVPTIQQLKPGVVEVVSDANKKQKFFGKFPLGHKNVHIGAIFPFIDVFIAS